MITDKLRSYGAARAKMGLAVEHRQHKGLNNRAENSHQPTRRREQIMKRFKSARQAHGFCRFTIKSPTSSTSLILTPSRLTSAALRASEPLRLGAKSPRQTLLPDLASQENRLSSARHSLKLTTPCHPPIFNDETEPKAKTDYFGGVHAKQHIVCALMQGPDSHYAECEAIAREIYKPVMRAHRCTVEQLAILEPALSETVGATFALALREAADEAVRRGVPKQAAIDFIIGHLNIELAIAFGIWDR